jgi:hypothetical protein
MLRRFALPEDKVPCPSVDFGAGNSHRSGIVVKNRRTGCRETPCRPAVPWQHRRAPEVFGRSRRQHRPLTPRPHWSRHREVRTRAPFRWLRSRLCRALRSSIRSARRSRPVRVWSMAAATLCAGGSLSGFSMWQAMTRLSFTSPTVAARRQQVNRTIAARSHVENRLEVAYSHISHYSHRRKP